MNLEHLTYWPAQINNMGHLEFCVFTFVGMWVTTIWGLLTTAANAHYQKISYSYYISLAHETYVKFVLNLYCFIQSVNWEGEEGSLVCFLLLGKTPKPKHPGKERFTPSHKSARNPETGTKNRSWGTLPTGLLASSYLATLWHNSSHLLGMVLPHGVLSPPASIRKKKIPTGIHTVQHTSGGSSAEALFQGVSRWLPK